MRKTRHAQRGAALIEFVFAGIAAIMLMITTVQLSLAMWNYHTLSYAVHETNRYITTHGRNCGTGGNSCLITVGDIATKLASNAVGISPGSVSVTLTSNSGVVQNCNPLSSCNGNATRWPPAAHFDNFPGRDTKMAARLTINSAMIMLWAGAGSARIGSVTLPAYSQLKILY